ncbi:hypothetical protein D3C73_1295690 [compost metagenome]
MATTALQDRRGLDGVGNRCHGQPFAAGHALATGSGSGDLDQLAVGDDSLLVGSTLVWPFDATAARAAGNCGKNLGR